MVYCGGAPKPLSAKKPKTTSTATAADHLAKVRDKADRVYRRHARLALAKVLRQPGSDDGFDLGRGFGGHDLRPIRVQGLTSRARPFGMA